MDYLIHHCLGTEYGDGNLDGRVDIADYTIWADGFGTENPGWADGDYNGDGEVGAADYSVWADNFNFGTTSTLLSANVPEPGAAAVVFATLPVLFTRRRVNAFVDVDPS